MKRPFDRAFPVERKTRMLVAVGALVPSLAGASVIGVITDRSLPTAAALGEPGVMQFNAVVSAIYAGLTVPPAALTGLLCATVPRDHDEPAAARHRLIVALPARLTAINAAVWVTAAVLLTLANLDLPWLATTLGISTLLGGTVTAALTYWFCTRVLRSFVAEVLTQDPPERSRGPGLRLRAVSSWVVGTGVPLTMVMLVAASALVVECSTRRLATAVLVLGGVTVLAGLVVAAFTGTTIADPIDEVRRGMRRIERGDFDVAVPVFDATELGLLQAGFNKMAAGLRERERLRDLFGRHVGRDVAQLAEQLDSGADPPLHGAHCHVAVLFVDVVGSTLLAATIPAADMMAMLNDFFAVVVDVVEHHGGLVNKFEGDAALAIFGAPIPSPDCATEALSAARELDVRLNSLESGMKFAVGVSAGTAAAGNVGGISRYEYTVIGDPVNEASRLTEVAKELGGLAASGAALSRAQSGEARLWKVVQSQVLRGRLDSTDIAVPKSRIDG